jgi:hypothetical protein
VAFTPDNAGEEQGLLLLESNDPDIELEGVPGRFKIDLLARGIDPTIFLSPSGAHEFGYVPIGDREVLQVTVRNASNDPLELTSIHKTAGSSP